MGDIKEQIKKRAEKMYAEFKKTKAILDKAKALLDKYGTSNNIPLE